MGILKRIFGGAGPAPNPPAPPRPAASQPPRIREISAEDLKPRLDRAELLLVVDMRQPWEYQAGHIPGAVNIFANDLPTRVDELPKDREIVFQCWHGNMSRQASMYLIDNGWAADRVASLSGGISGWLDAHGEPSLVKETGPGA